MPGIPNSSIALQKEKCIECPPKLGLWSDNSYAAFVASQISLCMPRWWHRGINFQWLCRVCGIRCVNVYTANVLCRVCGIVCQHLCRVRGICNACKWMLTVCACCIICAESHCCMVAHSLSFAQLLLCIALRVSLWHLLSPICATFPSACAVSTALTYVWGPWGSTLCVFAFWSMRWFRPGKLCVYKSMLAYISYAWTALQCTGGPLCESLHSMHPRVYSVIEPLNSCVGISFLPSY